MTTTARASTIPMQHARVKKDFGGKGVEKVSVVLTELTYTDLLQLDIHIGPYTVLLMFVDIYVRYIRKSMVNDLINTICY